MCVWFSDLGHVFFENGMNYSCQFVSFWSLRLQVRSPNRELYRKRANYAIYGEYVSLHTVFFVAPSPLIHSALLFAKDVVDQR